MSHFFPELKILALSHSFNHRTYYEHVIHCIALSVLDDIKQAVFSKVFYEQETV